MAAAVRISAVGGSSTGTGDRTATITPAAGDLLVVYCCVAANSNDTPTCSDNNGSGTYDRIDIMNFAIAAVNYRMSVFVRTALMVNTTSTVVTVATGSNTSGAVHVLAMTGVTRVGADAVRSKGSQNNQAAGTAAPTLNQAALTGNGTLVAHGSADTTTTPPTNWTEIQDTNFSNDTVALETAFRASGFTGTAITFGAASSTQFCSHALELDVTVAPVPLTQSAADSVDNLADARALGYGNLHADSVNNLADTAQVVVGYVLAASDSVNNLVDGAVQVVGVATTLTDTLAALADAQAQLLAYLLALTDTTAANWADAHQLLLSQRLALADDATNVADAAAVELTYLTAFSDSLPALADTETHALAIALEFSDSVDSLTDSLRVSLGLALADPLPFVESTASAQPDIVFLDPGGDATGAVGHFNTVIGGGTDISYDTSQKAVGVGSYRFDSGDGTAPITAVGVSSILGTEGHRRISFYFRYDSIPDPDTSAVIAAAMDVDNQALGLSIAVVPQGDGVVIRFVNAVDDSLDGTTVLLPDEWNRISFSYFENAFDDADIKIYINGVEELSAEEIPSGDTSPPLLHFQYGWMTSPGAGHLCWFDQAYIDKGDDLSDPGDILITAKLPASTNQDNWDITGGTGAVDERPLSETNYRQQPGGTQTTQTYMLQTAAAGDVDISGQQVVGYLGWAWARRQGGDINQIALVVNGTNFTRGSLSASPVLLRNVVTTTNYPSNAAGIGMLSNDDSASVLMYECGVVVAYTTSTAHDSLALGYGLLVDDTLSLTDSHAVQLGQRVVVTDSLDTLADSYTQQLIEVTGEIELSFADQFTLADSATVQMDHLIGLADSLSLTDSVALGLGYLIPLADSLALTDSVSIVLGYNESAADALDLTDATAIQLGHLPTFADTVALTDSLAVGIGLVFADGTATLTDTFVLQLQQLFNFSDTLVLTDGQLLVIEHREPLTDSLAALTDAEVHQLEQRLAFSDSVNNLNDALALTLGEVLSFSDAITLTDSPCLGYGLVITDDINLLGDDIVTSAPQGPLRQVGVTDSLDTFSDSLTLQLGHLLVVADTANALTDAVQLLEGLRITFSDSFSLIDSTASILAHGQSLADSLALTDSVELRLAYELAASDTLLITDTATSQLGHLLTFSDNAALLADSAVKTVGLTVIIADNGPTLTDTVTLSSAGFLQLSDTIVLSDSLITFAAYFATFSDSLTLTDAIAIELRGPDLDEALADALDLTDAITIVLADELQLQLTFADIVTLTDHYFDLRHPYTPSAKRHIVVPSRTRTTVPVGRNGIVVPSSDRTTTIQ